MGAVCKGGGARASPSSGGRACEGIAILCIGDSDEDEDAEEGAEEGALLPAAPLLRVLRERYSDTSEPS